MQQAAEGPEQQAGRTPATPFVETVTPGTAERHPVSSAKAGKDKHKGARLANDIHQETVDSCKGVVAAVNNTLFSSGKSEGAIAVCTDVSSGVIFSNAAL